jgi:hypothetical protein
LRSRRNNQSLFWWRHWGLERYLSAYVSCVTVGWMGSSTILSLQWASWLQYNCLLSLQLEEFGIIPAEQLERWKVSYSDLLVEQG